MAQTFRTEDLPARGAGLSLGAGAGLAAAAAVLVIALVGGAPLPAALAAAFAAAAAVVLVARRPAPRIEATPSEAAQAAAAAAAMHFAALEALPDPLMLIAALEPDDLAGRRILFANAAARTFLRIPREGSLLVGAIRRPELLEAVDESLFGDIPSTVAYETGGAQDRFWRVWVRPLERAPDGRRLALVLMRDETDARRNERMRADFLANASHELRTPLASLTGFIDTLRGHAKEDPAARDKFLGIMADQAGRMGRLIDDLLSLSRIELNEHIPPSDVCDFALIVADVADALTPIARDKSVKIQLDLTPKGVARILADRDQIVQVTQNLLANAVKYAPAGGEVRVRLVADLSLDQAQAPDPASPRRGADEAGRLPLLTPDRAEGDRYALLKIADTGPGMKREHLPRLSERFYRVEGQKSGDRQGTGLGLAIVKHIVNRHRGGVIVEAAPGLGAEFSVYLPMAGSAVPAAPPVLAAETKLS